ncbi:helix-turn-helix domain-containing protein [Streptomyces sp. NPDC047017]|uniref:TetR/AcrR family transcriptional regulator n=1 Tax=Streptomyces sp. NPDC047017 TaxID=3155024 RepID=UPI0033E6BAA3
MTETMGRRERKKAATRQALADAALTLFLERGYDAVGIKEIAEAADVSTTTLFKHFPSKEALVFDQDADLEAALISAVRDRPPGTPVTAALREHVLRSRLFAPEGTAEIAVFRELIRATPALSAYQRRMWMRHEHTLAAAIAAELDAPADDPACAALAHFALEARSLITTSPDPRTAVETAFALLEGGWEGVRPGNRATGQAG